MLIVVPLLVVDAMPGTSIKSPMSCAFSTLYALIIIMQIGYAAAAATATATDTATPTAESRIGERHYHHQQQQQNAQQRELTISECAAKGGECDELKQRVVCGTDDRTYSTHCHLLRVQCSGHQVSLKHRGPCKVCKEARDYALKHRPKDAAQTQTTTASMYVPRCKTDGTYAPMQCLRDAGCWCADFMGAPIANTTMRFGKPDCRRFNRANIRRSSPAHLQQPQQRQQFGAGVGIGGGMMDTGRRLCTGDDQLLFKSNLLHIFQSEYKRQHQLSATQVEQQQQQQPKEFERKIIDWKFNALDVNDNRMLDKHEFRELKKLVRQVVKPKRCGRTFGKMCDNNDDERLSRGEWNACISKSGMPSSPLAGATQPSATHSLSVPLYVAERERPHVAEPQSEPETEEDNTSDYDPDVDGETEVEAEDDAAGGAKSRFGGASTLFPSIYFLRQKPDTTHKELENESHCMAEQAAALEDQRNGDTIYYVPDCMPDGRRYKSVQCYSSTPYCWCVHEDTGKYIAGTSTKHKIPHCINVSAPVRLIKGCPEPRKTHFLKALKEFFKLKIIPNANLESANSSNWKTEDERIGYLSFVVLDKNKNKFWERKEWKSFRELMTNNKALRKCGRKMPKYCDANGDKKIVLSEWLECLQPTPFGKDEATSSSSASSSPSSSLGSATSATLALASGNDNGGGAGGSRGGGGAGGGITTATKSTRLLGSNPLEQYLKD